MRRIHGALAAVLVCGLALPSSAWARQAARDVRETHISSRADSTPAPEPAAQTSPKTKAPSRGGRLLKSTLIGAGVGAAVAGFLAHALGDCGDCGPDGQAMASGAFYGGLIGAAIGAIPVRGPHPSRQRATVRSTLTPKLKMVSMAVRF
jgi:hypothetical protein